MVRTKPKSIYTVKTGPADGDHPTYKVEKWNTDGEHETDYFISTRPFLCTCYAGVKTEPCRHKQIYGIFAGENRIDKGGFYMWDQNPKHRGWHNSGEW
jgi:hypothetical protein